MDELRAALELATEEELQDLTAILFSRKFNPLDYVHTPEPIEVQSKGRKAWLDALEQRFRFLAADGMTVLRGRTGQVTYRQALIQVCKYLKMPYSSELTTVDLEAEVFLHLLGHVWKKLPDKDKQKLTVRIQRQLAKAELTEPLPLTLQQDPLGLLFKGGSALAVTSVLQPLLLKQIARQFAIHFATYQVAKQAMIQGSGAAAHQFQNYVAMQMARQGMAVNAARYG
ncbi:MAG: YaaW family protein, partial [Brasilonema sp.]